MTEQEEEEEEDENKRIRPRERALGQKRRNKRTYLISKTLKLAELD